MEKWIEVTNWLNDFIIHLLMLMLIYNIELSTPNFAVFADLLYLA